MDVAGLDVFRMLEDYYERSEQLPARVFALGDDRYGLARARCGARWWVERAAYDAASGEA
jgi:hypothetical protein